MLFEFTSISYKPPIIDHLTIVQYSFVIDEDATWRKPFTQTTAPTFHNKIDLNFFSVWLLTQFDLLAFTVLLFLLFVFRFCLMCL